MTSVKTSTSTQIRNFYSEDMSYMNIKFYNTSLSFQLFPFLEKGTDDRSKYDMRNGQQTTVSYEGAFALYQASKDIIDGKANEMSIEVECLEAKIKLERKLAPTGKMETIFTLSKKNVDIPFKFKTIDIQVREQGQLITKQIEVQLGAFMKTIEGYLNGINADRHLDKLTADFANANDQSKMNKHNNMPGQFQPNQYRPYNNPSFGNQGFGQNMSTFSIQN